MFHSNTCRPLFLTTTEPSQAALRLIPAFLLVLILLSPLALHAQGNYVYVNNQGVANSISGFAVSSTGALSPVPGSPYLTGGVGSTTTCIGLDRITISAPQNLLFVSNSGDQTISVFQINAATGALTAAAGSPMPSGLTLDQCQGISLAATPDGAFLMASSNGQIQTFAIGAGGTLTPVATTANCCSPTIGMKISAHGQLLAVSNESSVSVYSINADGSLTAPAGSPYPRTGAGLVSGLDFSCAGDRLYGGEASFANGTITDGWSVASDGTLTALAGSPFLGAGTDGQVVLLSPDNSVLFTSDQFNNKINSSSIAADGSLTKIGSFGGVTSVHVPTGLATDASGSFLYAADENFGIAVFSINGTGSLKGLSNIPIDRVGEIQGLAAYPPRSCTSADLALTQTALPTTVESGSNVTYTITVTNNGPDATSSTIIDNLPAGTLIVSCASTGGGVCNNSPQLNPHTVMFASLASGESETITIVAATSASLLNGASLINTVSVGNKSAVDPDPTNNSATATIAITAQAGPSTLTVSPATAPFGGLAILSATLRKASNGGLISGKTITFALNGATVGTAVTNGAGQAFFTTSIAGVPLGAYAGAISASFAGDTLFTASSGTGSLTVNRAVLTVVANSVARLYLDPNPPFTYTITGFLNGDTAAVVSGTTTCSTVVPTDASTPPGRYAIHCPVGSLAAANYTFAMFDGVLVVNKPPLTVMIDSATRVYGDPNPAFTGTITGLRGTDVITATYSSPATDGSPVGTYPIVPNFIDPAGVLDNYNLIVTNGTLTVTPAPLSVTADNASRVYGDPNPIFTGTILGIKNGDNISATYTSVAAAGSPVGTYPIVANLIDLTHKLGNYTVTKTDGSLTITQAPLTVTAADASRLYGNPNPVFTGTIVGIKNGDAITATYSTPATVTSDVGTYPINPALVDPTLKLGNYAVTSINGVLTINPSPLTFTAANASRVYGNANPAFTGTFVGLKNGDVLTLTFTSADITSPVGTYPIVPAVGGAKAIDYTVTLKNGTLTITQAPLTVAGPSGNQLYGDLNPPSTFTGLKNNDNITATLALPTVTSVPGTYVTVPALVDPTSKLGNYTVTVRNGSITVNKAPLSVTANSFSRPFGSANPTLTGVTTGIRNGENITASFSTTATQSSNVGTFAITPAIVFSPASLSGNYNLTTAAGTLTITTVPLTITSNNQTVVLNGTVAASATYSGFVLGQGPANLAGTLTCSSNGSTIGTHTLSCSGQSSTNYSISFVNTGVETVTYAPVGTCSNGPGHQILAPIATNGSTQFTKAATPTIPVQFRVCDAKGASISSTVVSSFTLTSINGVPVSTPAPQGGPFTFVGGTLLNGAGSSGWQFILSTGNLTAGNTYAYSINLNDGTSLSFQFRLN
ncbi:MAG TPA: MBG domain-containing protein [Candidatus Angelobacter sp.]|nr:MBG domain-containing protein [Candidatus Angelobacter sp.]